MTSAEHQRSSFRIYENEMCDYFASKCQEDLLNILKAKDASQYYPIVVDHLDFSLSCPKSNKILPFSPEKVFSEGDKALVRALSQIYDKSSDKDRRDLIPKEHVHFRIHSLSFPGQSPFYKHSFPGSKEVGLFVALVGTVVRTSVMKPVEYKRPYRCNRCKKVTLYEASAGLDYRFPKVLDKCANLCNGAKVEAVTEGDEGTRGTIYLKDQQEIKLQEKDTRMDFSSNAKSCWVVLEGDLMNSCKPGDDVVITGTMFLKWKRFRANHEMEAEIFFKANHLSVINDQCNEIRINSSTVKDFETFWSQQINPFQARNTIIKSFCPEIYGMYILKCALCVALAGGVSKVNGGSKIRGESHMLLVGDPGTGKSQLLKYASKLIPRSVLTNGLGVTSAGLTVTAIKDSDDWHLEAGALVLADGGVCCIDEFSNMKEHDRVSIHEAMEQQSISVAKAGLVCSLSTKCTVLAATNPKLTKYDCSESPEVNIGLPSPLLSRFDLLMVLRDAENDSWDELLGNFIVKGQEAVKRATKNARRTGTIWTREMLQQYFVLIRELCKMRETLVAFTLINGVIRGVYMRSFISIPKSPIPDKNCFSVQRMEFIKEKQPEMSSEAETILGAYYRHQRNSAKRDVARTTVRFLESLFRLAEGHARLMYRDRVIVHDAISAIMLMEASMNASALTNIPNALHICFPEDPLEEYYNQAKMILSLLNLESIWDKDVKIYLDCLKSNVKKTRPPSPAVMTSTQVIPQTPPRFFDESDKTFSPISNHSSKETASDYLALASKQSLSPQISTSSVGKNNKNMPLESKMLLGQGEGELKRKRSSESPKPVNGNVGEEPPESPKETSAPVKRKRIDLSRFRREED